jgi:hypothetical protein
MKYSAMFTRKDTGLFLASGAMVLGGYLCMGFDPVPNGFGVLTLTIAPLLLLVGFFLPIVGIAGTDHFKASFRLSAFRDEWQKHIVGFGVLVIALITYTLTLEPTASLWDCSETIASAYKLQVPHTPGTPLTLLIGRAFTMLALGDKQNVAWCMNFMSAFFSALSVLLVYHIIVVFAGNILRTQRNDNSKTNFFSISAGVCGSLCLTFSDTFWFSAVEAETYGIACFFLLLIIWLVIKGKDLVEPLRSRYLVLIAYITALAYCIHPMCVLVVPILPFLWYVNTRTLSFKILVLSVLAGLFIVFAINKFVAIGLFGLAFKFDLFFVNSLSLPFYSGAIFLALLIVAIFFWLITKFSKHQVYAWSIAFLLLGFLPYLMLFIRSNHNPPIDETNPENLAMIKAYMNRESYPTSPLLVGPYFDAQINEVVNTGKAYYKTDREYKLAGNLIDYSYDEKRTTFLPRMYSREDDHIAAYRQWTGLKANEQPTFSDNLYFMFTCQLGHMYMRYFLWNVTGREGDVQGSSWLTPWERLAGEHDSKARNQYWMIPLVLGLLGAFIQFNSDKKNFFGNLIFFLLTGLILAVYLNSPPVEPRERDYIYVGSYIAFFIWTGLGLLIFRQSFIPEKVQRVLLIVIAIVLPSWMLYQNADDHDRSGRTFQMDYARQVLNSCAPNAIMFTGGDNDTFPYWYLQEVEGLRTDVRVVVLSYFNSDWYINQLRNQYYDSKPFNLALSSEQYRQHGLNDILYVQKLTDHAIDFTRFLKLVNEGGKIPTMQASNGDAYNVMPSDQLRIPVAVNPSSGSTSVAFAEPSELKVSITDNVIYKNALAVLDVITSNAAERPIYFNYTSLNTLGLDLSHYVVDEGLLYRLTGEESSGETPPVDTEAAYKTLVANADYSNLKRKDVFFNHEDFVLRMITPLKQNLNSLAATYLEKGDTTRAREVITYSADNLFQPHLKTTYVDIYTADILRATGDGEKAKHISKRYFNENFPTLTAKVSEHEQPSRAEVYFITQAARLLAEMGEVEYAGRLDSVLPGK